MSNYSINIGEYIRPIGIRNNNGEIKFSGTGFGIEKAGLVLTAAHVVLNTIKPDEIYIELPSNKFLQASSIKFHPSADIAALTFESDPSLHFFKLGNPKMKAGHFHLGTEIISYGYPFTRENPDKINLEPRLMCGHIQRNFQHKQNNYNFRACELSFPVIKGQSGSPILLVNDIESAIAILVSNFESSTIIDSYEEHHENGGKEIHKIKKVISYGIGVELWPIKDWIMSFG